VLKPTSLTPEPRLCYVPVAENESFLLFLVSISARLAFSVLTLSTRSSVGYKGGVLSVMIGLAAASKQPPISCGRLQHVHSCLLGGSESDSILRCTFIERCLFVEWYRQGMAICKSFILERHSLFRGPHERTKQIIVREKTLRPAAIQLRGIVSGHESGVSRSKSSEMGVDTKGAAHMQEINRSIPLPHRVSSARGYRST